MVNPFSKLKNPYDPSLGAFSANNDNFKPGLFGVYLGIFIFLWDRHWLWDLILFSNKTYAKIRLR